MMLEIDILQNSLKHLGVLRSDSLGFGCLNDAKTTFWLRHCLRCRALFFRQKQSSSILSTGPIDSATTHQACLMDGTYRCSFLKKPPLQRGKKNPHENYLMITFWGVIPKYFQTIHLLRCGLSVNCSFRIVGGSRISVYIGGYHLVIGVIYHLSIIRDCPGS